MPVRIHGAILLATLLGGAPSALQAHHSVALNFTDDEITLQGTITSLRWVNPHCTFVLKVQNDTGGTEEWLVEMLARIALQRQGFDFDSLHEGMDIQLTGRLGYRDLQPAVRRSRAPRRRYRARHEAPFRNGSEVNRFPAVSRSLDGFSPGSPRE